MNIEETKTILKVLRANYPHSFKDFTQEDTKDYLMLWQDFFKDDDYGLVKAAVKSIIAGDTREFAPNIGQVKDKMYSLVNRDEMTEQEAWLEIKKAISRSGWYAQEEYDRLPPLLQRLVGSADQLHDWSQMDSDELNTIVASNFMRSYKAKSKSAKEYQMLPNEVKIGIETMIGKNLLEGKEK